MFGTVQCTCLLLYTYIIFLSTQYIFTGTVHTGCTKQYHNHGTGYIGQYI